MGAGMSYYHQLRFLLNSIRINSNTSRVGGGVDRFLHRLGGGSSYGYASFCL